jgi:sugar phosphate isomerase/epimerase
MGRSAFISRTADGPRPRSGEAEFDAAPGLELPGGIQLDFRARSRDNFRMRSPRRDFLKQSLVLTAAAAAGRFSAPAVLAETPGKPPMSIRLGGPAYNAPADPDDLARAHRQLGYRAAYCPNLSLKEPEKIRAVEKAFARQDVVIAEVGRWVNLLDADPEKRRQNLQQVTDGLALAEAVGARCCVDIAGSFSTTSWFGPHPENLGSKYFDAAVENARKIIDAVKPARASFCYEMMGWALPDSVENCRKLLMAVDRKAFGVHLDPCNLVNSPERFYDNTALLNDCFDKLGRWIVSCHAKDLAWEVEMNVHFKEVVPGKGSLDYGTFLKRLAALPQDPPLMIEHLANAEEYAAAAKYITSAGEKAGVSFGEKATL